MPEYPPYPFGPSISEIQQVTRDEFERRRRLRILQVRMQAKRNAIKVRMLYNAKKQQLSDVIAKDLQIKRAREDVKLLEAKKYEYCSVMNQYGIGHRSAENWSDPTLETYWKLSVAQKQAEDRFNIAVDKLHKEKLIQDLTQHETQERIKEVRNTEKKRAALIASLPPPKGILSEEILKPALACEPLVLVYDIEARNTTHTQNVQSRVVVKSINVDEEKDIGPQSAAISACKEEQRIQAVELENAIHAREDLIKADMRGRQAMRKERVRQYYQALLNRLDEVKRNEILLRRGQLYSGTVDSSHGHGGGPWDDAVVNRRMEKVFEDELLYQLSNINHEEYIDDIEENTLENDNNNNNDINGCNDVLDVEGKQKSLPVKDVKLTNDSNLVEQPMSLSNDQVLELYQDINDVDEISHHDEQLSVIEEKEELMHDEKKSVNSIDLGPGERPILPDIRRCRILSESINFTNSIHNINHNETCKLVHGNSKISPQSVALSKTSFQDKSTSDICTDNENIQLRQKVLDEELDMIDKRINRLRLGSACDLHESQSHSIKLSRKDLEESTEINNNITPRNMYIVEGCVYGDNGVSDRKDSSNLPIDLLNTKPKKNETPSLPLISQPTTTVALNVFSSESIAVSQKISASMASNDQSTYNTESTVVKYCISKPITGVLAERARDLIRIQKAKLLNLKKYKSTSELSQSSHTSNQSSIDMDSEISTNSSATNMEINKHEDVSCFSPNDSKQIMDYCSIPNLGKHSSGWCTNDDKQSFEFSLQENINMYESSIPSTTTPVIVNKSVQSPKSQYDYDAHDKSLPNEIIIHDDVVQDVSKTPNHDLCFETVSCIQNLNKRKNESYKHPHELNTVQISNEKSQNLEINIPFELSPSDPPIKISSQSTHLVNIPPMNNNLSTLQSPSSSSSSSTLSPQSSINSPSSIGSQQTMPLLSSSDKPQSLESYTTSDTLKAELKALLTSSLINSIISHNSSVTTDTNDLKRLFSSQSYLLSSLSGIYRNAKTQTTEISSETELPYPITSNSSISPLNPSQLSFSPKNAQLEKLSDNTSNDQQSNANSTERPLCDGHMDNRSIESNYPNKLTLNNDLIKTIKQRILNKYINANKEWLVTLSGLNNGKLLQTNSSSSSSSNSGVEFNYLSEVTDNKEINWSETRSDSSSLRSKQISISKSPEPHEIFSSPQTNSPLSMIYSARFKPLPRLEEATSEESIHTVQVISDFNNLSNTPSSWTDSRKSSEFGNLSNYSTINSNTTYIPDKSLKNENTDSFVHDVPNNEVNSHHLSEENDTIKQLLDNIPNTPIEPNNNEIVPYLGSKLSSTSLSEKLDDGTVNVQEFDLKIISCAIPVNDQRNNVTTSGTPVIINAISSDKIPDENLSENSRPSSPAEGAVSKFSSSYHQNVKFNVSNSLPSVFVESMDGCEKYQRQTETVHYSSDNSLKAFIQTNEASLTDSLLSFERHEVRCDLLSNSGTCAAGGGLKSQFPDTLSNNVDAKNVSPPTDILNNKKTTEKPTITHSKYLTSEHTIKDCMNNQRDRIPSNRVVVKTSNTRKLDSFVCTSSKQKTTRSGIVQSMSTTGQRLIRSKPSNVNVPSSSTQITRRSSLKSANVTNLSVNSKRLPSIPVCTPNSTRLSSKQIKVSESYICTKLNPFNQAKVLQMELSQWQQKRLKCYQEPQNNKMTISTSTVIPKTDTNCISIDVDNNIPLIPDDNVHNIIDLKNIPGSMQIKSDQQTIENNQSSPSNDNVNQTSVDLTVVNEDQPVLSSLPGIDDSYPPLAVCSGDLSIIKPVSEMNVPGDSTAPVSEHPNNVNFQLTSAIPPPDVSKPDNHCVKKISAISCTPMSSSKSYERNDSTLFDYGRRQRAHANRQRVKEFDRIRREQLMKRRV
ncbi:unnamed protein product [Schistosoma rodhaini]|uniref:Uncharacterized protein n=2 Tax=Schistosoma rodhaini TaxID=6188 RepID=A0AA85F8E1_9TREM|nr:unnamed protein product [Schistosoma rodhaini]